MKKIAPLLMIFSLSACSQRALLVTQSDEIMKLSEEYFNNLAAQKYDTAYLSISNALRQISSEALWAEDKKKFKQLSGEVSSVNITKVTVYVRLHNKKAVSTVANRKIAGSGERFTVSLIR